MAVTYVPDALKVSIKMIGSLTEETSEEPKTITPDINVDDDSKWESLVYFKYNKDLVYLVIHVYLYM